MREAAEHAKGGRYQDAEAAVRRADESLGSMESARSAVTKEALASVLVPQGRHADAIVAYTKALRIRESLDPRRYDAEAMGLRAVSSSRLWLGQLEPALRSARLSIRRATLAGEPHQLLLARCRVQLALVLKRSNDLPNAESELRLALSIFRQKLPPSHSDLAECYLNLGWIKSSQRELGAARDSLTIAARIYEATRGAAAAESRLAQYGLSLIAIEEGRLGTAKAMLEGQILLANRNSKRDLPDAQIRLRLAGMLLDAGIDRGVEELLAVSQVRLPSRTSLRRAQKLALGGEWKRAQQMFDQANVVDDPILAALATILRADALIREGRTSAARKTLEEGSSPVLASSPQPAVLIAACDVVDKEFEAGVRSARSAISEFEKLGFMRFDVLARAEVILGQALRLSGKPTAAKKAYMRAKARIESLGTSLPELKGACLAGLAQIKRAEGDIKEAQVLMREAAHALKGGAATVREAAAPVMLELADLLEDEGAVEDAKRLRAEAKQLTR